MARIRWNQSRACYLSLATPKRTPIEAGRGYFLGASSMPAYVIVLSVSDDRIVYAFAGSLTRSVSERWIAEDLISRGGATMTKTGRGARHGAPASASDYDRLRVLAAPTEEMAGNDLWYAAEMHGNVGMIDGLYEIELRRSQLDGLMADGRFEIKSVDLIAMCPAA